MFSVRRPLLRLKSKLYRVVSRIMMLCAAGQPVSCQQLRSSLLQRPARPLLPCLCQHHASTSSSVCTGINSALAMMPQQLQGSRSSRCYVLAAASKKSSAVAGGKGFGSATKTTPSKSSSRANQSCPCGSGKSYQVGTQLKANQQQQQQQRGSETKQ